VVGGDRGEQLVVVVATVGAGAAAGVEEGAAGERAEAAQGGDDLAVQGVAVADEALDEGEDGGGVAGVGEAPHGHALDVLLRVVEQAQGGGEVALALAAGAQEAVGVEADAGAGVVDELIEELGPVGTWRLGHVREGMSNGLGVGVVEALAEGVRVGEGRGRGRRERVQEVGEGGEGAGVLILRAERGGDGAGAEGCGELGRGLVEQGEPGGAAGDVAGEERGVAPRRRRAGGVR
jgi:hypothetical protein